MFSPKRLFGSDARQVSVTEPLVLGRCNIASYQVQALRYNLVDFEVAGRRQSDGYFLVYEVSADNCSYHLQQQRTAFYVRDGSPDPSDRKGKVPQGDGVAAPRWHKCDRLWPVLDGQPYSFVGQGYYQSMVVYLFRLPSTTGEALAIFHDDVDRQDAEEHYRLEDRAWRDKQS